MQSPIANRQSHVILSLPKDLVFDLAVCDWWGRVAGGAVLLAVAGGAVLLTVAGEGSRSAAAGVCSSGYRPRDKLRKNQLTHCREKDMPIDIKAIGLRLMEEVWNNRNLNLVDEVIDPSYAYHDPNSPEFGLGPKGYKARVVFYATAFPDMRFVIEDAIAEGDKVVLRWQASGTHRGELLGIPATGKFTSGSGLSILQFKNGKVVDDWCLWDTLSLLRQLGALPTAAKGHAA